MIDLEKLREREKTAGEIIDLAQSFAYAEKHGLAESATRFYAFVDAVNGMQARLAQLEKDAGRYKWLRANKLHMTPATMDGPSIPCLRFSYDVWAEKRSTHNAEGLDSAIDTAMEASNG